MTISRRERGAVAAIRKAIAAYLLSGDEDGADRVFAAWQREADVSAAAIDLAAQSVSRLAKRLEWYDARLSEAPESRPVEREIARLEALLSVTRAKLGPALTSDETRREGYRAARADAIRAWAK